MDVFSLLVFAVCIQLTDAIWGISFNANGTKFSRLKEDAERKFLREQGYRSVEDFVKDQWLNVWKSPKSKKKFPATKFKKRKSRDWWHKSHIYVPPKKKKCRRRKGRRRACKRDVWNIRRSAVLSRSKRQTCQDIPTPPNLVRREWRQMSVAERNSFRSAFLQLANNNAPGTSKPELEVFVEQHRFTNSPSSQCGAGFLPWHREYLWRFSNRLRANGYTGAVPYWDSTREVLIPNPADSAVWTPENFGASSGIVSSWGEIVTIDSCVIGATRHISREMNGISLMFTKATVNEILAKECFQDLTCGWDPQLEVTHERLLMAMGTPTTAQMANPNCAPFDPVYWMHLAFLDLIWERYRESQDFNNREIEYPEENLACNGCNGNRHRWGRRMKPFEGLVNAHGMSNFYTSYYYTYSTPPCDVTCNNNNQCGGDMFWCLNNACIAKIREGGECSANWPNVQCYCQNGNPVCNDNQVCQCN